MLVCFTLDSGREASPSESPLSAISGQEVLEFGDGDVEGVALECVLGIELLIVLTDESFLRRQLGLPIQRMRQTRSWPRRTSSRSSATSRGPTTNLGRD